MRQSLRPMRHACEAFTLAARPCGAPTTQSPLRGRCHRRHGIARAAPGDAGPTSTQATQAEAAEQPAPLAPSEQPSSPEPAAASGLALPLSTPASQAAAFKALAAASAFLAVAALGAPHALLAAAGGAASGEGALDAVYLQIAGASLVISAAVEYCLSDAAANGRLGSATYQRLLLGVVLKSSGYLLAFALTPGAWTPLVVALYPSAALASIVVAGATLLGATAPTGGVGAALPGLLPSSLSKTYAGWVYTIFLVLYVTTLPATLATAPLVEGGLVSPLGVLLSRTAAPGFLLAAVACFVLKEAADRGRLGASTFKRLNLGLVGLEASFSAVLATTALGGGIAATELVQVSGPVSTQISASLGVAGYCLYQFLRATR